jgi:restriction system protein
MTASEETIWGIHGGKTGDADTLFLKKKLIGLGWTDITDLSVLDPTREAFRAAVASAYPQAKPGAIPVNAGQLFRFVHEMKQGDLVVYPSKADRAIHIGRVTGDYRYDTNLEPGYPHQRPVTWLKTVQRTMFTQGALYEIGSAMSLFQVKNYAEEFRLVLEGKEASPVVEEDETVGLVADEIEETTRDFILKTLLQELKGHPFAQFVAHLLNTMGYRTRVSDPGPDRGIDIIAHRDELGFEPPIIKVQVKSSEGSSGNPEVASLYGNIGNDEFGLFVTLGTFTPAARNFAAGKSNLRLIDGKGLVNLVLNHYDQFDSRYKGILPLKRVYIPESLKEE